MTFYAAAAVAVIATALVITRRNAVHALLYLVVSFLAVAVMFFGLGAPLAAALEVIVYAGAVVVLFVFVVMMAEIRPAGPRRSPWRGVRTWAGPAGLALVLFVELAAGLLSGPAHGLGPEVPPAAVGTSLFSAYLLAVELAAVLLLAAVVGAFHLGERRAASHHRFFEEEPR